MWSGNMFMWTTVPPIFYNWLYLDRRFVGCWSFWVKVLNTCLPTRHVMKMIKGNRQLFPAWFQLLPLLWAPQPSVIPVRTRTIWCTLTFLFCCEPKLKVSHPAFWALWILGSQSLHELSFPFYSKKRGRHSFSKTPLVEFPVFGADKSPEITHCLTVA